MKKGYVASLAIAAAIILIAGYFVRPKPRVKPESPVQAPPAPTRRGQMRQISDFLAERATEVADHVVYVPSAKASGVIWPDERIVTTADEPALVSTASVINERQPAPVKLAPPARFSQAGWIVVVARNSQNQPITTSGLLGGVADAKCGPIDVRKLVFNTALDSAFAGGGIFDLSGDLLGMVIDCDNTWTAVTSESISALLSQQKGAESVAWHDFGVHVRAADTSERKLMHLPRTGGLFASEVRRNSPAFNMGVRPGDLLMRSGAEQLETTEDLLALGDTLSLIRDGRTLTLSLTPDYTLDLPTGGVTLTSVQQGTRLKAAGLEAGDRIVRAAGIEGPGPTDLNKLLSVDKPFWLVYEREDRRVWVAV
jgi:hypothetical protein